MLEPNFFIGSWPGWNRICQILILTLWLVTATCFLAKIVQILKKVIVFFLERGEEVKPWFKHIWIAQWLKFFRRYCLLFPISTIFRWNREVKVGPEVLLPLGPYLFEKNSKLEIFHCFCLPEDYLRWELRQYWIIFGE